METEEVISFHTDKLESEEAKEIGEISGNSGDDADGDDQPLLVTDNVNVNIAEDPPSLETSIELSDTVAVTKKRASDWEMNFPATKDEAFLGSHKEDDFALSNWEICANSLSGVKRPRITVDEEQPLVKVTYKSLTSDSKRKLKELLQQWSQWNAHHCSSSIESGKALESGEDTYFPGIQVGLDKAPAVSFWMEDDTRNNINNDVILLDEKSVPLYDRGFSLALTSTDDGSNNLGVPEVVEGSRCFNCGSYNHSLKECSKPRDNVAVNNARKQHLARRNQNTGSRNPTRYYQDTPGGKYDGLKPGTLDSETRQLLGLGELDPPPWLHRMREIGYPPGYLVVKEEDQPSGITIFGDDEIVEDNEEGEILEKSSAKPIKRMIVKYPGMNAPIPENADEKLWSSAPSDSSSYRHRPYSRYSQSSDSGNRSHYHDQRPPSSRGCYEDDEPPPPGCDNESPMTSFSSHSRRYGGVDSHYSHISRENIIPRSYSFGRSLSDRGRRNTVTHDGPMYYSYDYLSNSSPR